MSIQTNTEPQVKAAINGDILARISESEVKAWLCARLELDQTQNPHAHAETLQITATRYDFQRDGRATTNIYAWSRPDGCEAVHENSEHVDDALAFVRQKLGDNTPAAKAEQKRREASALIAEAEALEAKESGAKEVAQ